MAELLQLLLFYSIVIHFFLSPFSRLCCTTVTH